MRRRRPHARALVLVLAAALAACNGDGGGPTPPDGGGVPDPIQAQINALFPNGGPRAIATGHVEDVLELADDGQSAQALSRFLDFLAFAGAQSAAGALLDPNGGAAPTTEDALATLTADIADEAGLTLPDVAAAAFGEDGAVGTLDGAGGTVVTGNRQAGVQVFGGALAAKTLITIEPIPATGDPGDGPLPTDLPQFPRFYRIETFPPVAALAGNGGVVGVCVVDPPDPRAPALEVAARLRLAHPVPDLPGTIRILPLAEAPFLDCDGPANSLSPAAPGRLGGSISSFSPFAAVDPAGLGPTILSVTPNPITSAVTPGSMTEVVIAFADPDGNLDRIEIREVSDPNGVLDPTTADLSDLAGITVGDFSLNVGCPPEATDGCLTGTWVGDFVLVDAAGNESEPVRVTIVFE